MEAGENISSSFPFLNYRIGGKNPQTLLFFQSLPFHSAFQQKERCLVVPTIFLSFSPSLKLRFKDAHPSWIQMLPAQSWDSLDVPKTSQDTNSLQNLTPSDCSLPWLYFVCYVKEVWWEGTCSESFLPAPCTLHISCTVPCSTLIYVRHHVLMPL